MNVLEKILEEILQYRKDNSVLAGKQVMAIEEIIRSHMDEAKNTNVPSKDGWIPVEKKLPEVQEGLEDMYCPEFNVTIKGAEIATTLKYSWDGTWFDDYGTVYNVIAWQPLPERYKGGDDRA